MKVKCSINGRPGLYDSELKQICLLPENYRLLTSALESGVVDVITLDGNPVELLWHAPRQPIMDGDKVVDAGDVINVELEEEWPGADWPFPRRRRVR